MTIRAPIPLRSCLALITLATVAAPSAAQGARVALENGDIVLNVFDQYGSSVDFHAGDGILLAQFMAGTGQYWEGAAITPAGDFATTRRVPNGVNVFDENGVEVLSFTTSRVGTFAGDISVFADGTFAISDQSGDVELYDAAGSYVRTLLAPALMVPFGSWVDPVDDTLWVTSSDPLVPNAGALVQFDQLGSVLNTILTPWRVGDVVTSSTGTLWVSDRTSDRIVELDRTGSVLRAHALPTGGFSAAGIALDLDGTILATSVETSSLYRFDAVLGLLAVYPVASTGVPVFLAVIQEPGIEAFPDQISVSVGGSQVLSIDLGTRNASQPYLVLGTISGTSPGTAYGALSIPLNVDPYFLFTLANPNAPPLAASMGVLNSLGQATTVFSLGALSDPSLAGLSAHHAALAIDMSGPAPIVAESSDAVALALIP